MQQLRGKLEALSAAEQAAQSDATAVRGTLSHVVQTVAGMALPAELRASTTGQQAITPATGLLTSAAAADLDVQSCSGAGHEVEAALRALQSRISDLKQQVSQRDTLLTAEAAAAAQQAVQPERQAVGVQCEVLAVASTAVQVMPAEDGIAAACGTQTDTDAEDYGGAHGGTYGRPDALQQQLAELTAQLAASRLEAVAAKAEHSALEARLLDTEHQVTCNIYSLYSLSLQAFAWGCALFNTLFIKVSEMQTFHVAVASVPCAATGASEAGAGYGGQAQPRLQLPYSIAAACRSGGAAGQGGRAERLHYSSQSIDRSTTGLRGSGCAGGAAGGFARVRQGVAACLFAPPTVNRLLMVL